MQAVILAAGLGSRIREFHALPKGFICVGELPIIQESIAKLKRFGIQKILIVTGYRSECYDALAANDAAVTTIFNPHFQDKSSLYSLFCAKDWVAEDLLILESDILFESRALETVIDSEVSNMTLLSGETQSGDEVYVTVDSPGCILQAMSKNKAKLDRSKIHGEFVGISKLSYAAYQSLVALLLQKDELLSVGYYEEDGLVALNQLVPVYCHKVPDLLWCEIDDVAQLARARTLYSQLLASDSVASY